VGPSRGNLETTFDVLLTADLRKVGFEQVIGFRRFRSFGEWRYRTIAGEVIDQIRKGAHRVNIDSRKQCRFAGIVVRDEGASHPLCGCKRNHGDDAWCVTKDTIERELANDKCIVETIWHLFRGNQDADGNRQVVGWTGFLQVGRREIDRYPAKWEPTSAIPDRGSNPLFALLNRGIGQTHYDDARLPLADINFDLDEDAIETNNRAAVHLRQHDDFLNDQTVTKSARTINSRHFELWEPGVILYEELPERGLS
jgi:hypothetical protein